MTADTVAPYLSFFSERLYAIVFIAAAIGATGVPFPGRLLLITAGALVIGPGLARVSPGLIAYRLWRRRRHGPAASPHPPAQPGRAVSSR